LRNHVTPQTKPHQFSKHKSCLFLFLQTAFLHSQSMADQTATTPTPTPTTTTTPTTTPTPTTTAAATEPKPSQRKEKKEKKENKGKENTATKQQQQQQQQGTSLLGLTVKKRENFSEWYTQLVIKTELIDYYHDISGCYVIRPLAYSIWENIQTFFDRKIKSIGVLNAYFPLLVSKARLETEKNHIDGFSPEVAWVTKAGKKDLAEHIAIRPTSETIIYPSYAQWIRSYRDLPLKLNQWNSVVRWEFKDPVPFIRSREFLWQEGHTVFATKKEADEEVLQILDFYSQVFEDLLAIPVFKGFKSEGEKFAGGLYSTSCEAYIPAVGRGVQGATSHCLGQNFSTMFGIKFEDESSKITHAWQNSWGLSTRTLGILCMIHGDDKGLVLPPRVAPIQVVLVPIFKKNQVIEDIAKKAKEIIKSLTDRGIRAHFDDREHYQFGFKFHHWELKGVPLRLEFGPQELANSRIVTYRRDTNTKDNNVPLEGLTDAVVRLLDDIQTSLLNKAREERDSRLSIAKNWNEFSDALSKGNLIKAPWCEDTKCEDRITEKSKAEAKAKQEAAASDNIDTSGLTGGAKTLCIPLDQTPVFDQQPCFACGNPSKKWVLLGRSY